MDMKEAHEKGIFAAAVAMHESPISYGHDDDAENATAIIKAYLDASGMVMVPREPTERMLESAYSLGEASMAGLIEAYELFLLRAPNPFQTPE